MRKLYPTETQLPTRPLHSFSQVHLERHTDIQSLLQWGCDSFEPLVVPEPTLDGNPLPVNCMEFVCSLTPPEHMALSLNYAAAAVEFLKTAGLVWAHSRGSL